MHVVVDIKGRLAFVHYTQLTVLYLAAPSVVPTPSTITSSNGVNVRCGTGRFTVIIYYVVH